MNSRCHIAAPEAADRRLPTGIAVLLALVLAQAVAAAPITVRGRVTDADGVGLSGARVELQPLRSNFEIENSLLAGRRSGPSVGAATTARNGRFELELAQSGVCTVTVRAAGLIAMRFPLLPLTRSIELPPVVMLAEVQARIEVGNPAGEPVAGAAVWAQTSTPTLWDAVANESWTTDHRFGWTDQSGRLRVPRARGERLDITVFAPGNASSQRRQGVERATFVVEPNPSRRLAIEVRGARDEPMEGVVVAAGDLAWPIGSTDAGGRLSFGTADPAALALHLFTAGGGHHAVTLRPSEQGAERPTVFVLPEVDRREGRVLADSDRRPVAGALVWPARDPGAFDLTDSRGAFEWTATATADLPLRAAAAGFLPLSLAVDSLEMEREQLTLLLAAAGGVRGQIVDARGAPLAGVSVEAMPTSEAQRRQALRADWIGLRSLSDASGRFELRQLDPAGAYQLVAAREGFSTARIPVAAIEPSELRDLQPIRLERGRHLFGRVVDVDEQPVVEAEVRWLAIPDRLRSEATPRKPGSPAVEEAPTARTDAQGRFETWRPPARTFDIAARASGFAPFTVRGVRLPPGADPVDLGTLVLQPGVTIRGFVKDPDGRPIAGAGVWVLDELPEIAAPETPETQPSALAAEDGQFAVGDLESGRAVHLVCDHPGFLPSYSRGIEAPNRQPIEVVLRPGSSVSGRVVDADERPLAAAQIRLWAQEQPPGAATPPVGPWYRAVTADARGRFFFADVAPGPALIEASVEGFQPSEPRGLEIIDSESLRGLRIVLEEGAVLEGWISAENGDALADARVQIGRSEASSNTQGRYRLSGIPAGLRQVDLRRHGFNRTTREIEIELGVQRADFVLDGGRRVAGRAIDDTGSPIEGVKVQLVLDDALERQEHSELTAADGGFAWPEVADGRYRLQAEKEGFVTLAGRGLRVDGEAIEDLEILLRKGASITGRIFGLEPEELARVEIRATSDELPQGYGEVNYEGRYAIVDLGAGDWLVQAWVPGGSRQAEARVVLEPALAEVERDLEFGVGLTLTGRVLHDGEPLPGTSLRLLGRSVAASRSVMTDFAGGFRLQDLEVGWYRIELVNRAERLTYNQDLELSFDRELIIEIAASRVSGRVVSAADGQPLADALIAMQQLLGPDHGQGASLFTFGTDSEGFFGTDRLTAGWYRLTARKNGYQPVEERLEVPPGIDLDQLQIALRPTTGLEAVVRLASGRSTRFVTVSVSDTAGRVVVTETRVLDSDGFVRLDTIPPGTWDLLLSAPGGATTRRVVTVPGPPIEVVLVDAGRLKVRVPALVESSEIATLALVNQDGRPFRHLNLAGAVLRQWELTAGKATLEGVPPGAWTLRATAPSGATWLGSVVTTGGPDIEVNLE